MARFSRGLVSLSLFALFGAGSLLLSVFTVFAGSPERCHTAIRASWRVLLWMFEATRLIRVDRRGLPRCRGCVIVSNHPSLIDVVIFVALVPKTLFVAKHALVHNPFMAFVVRPASLPDDERLPEAARRRLEEGWNVLVFPEGTRSPESGLRPFRRGAAQVALRCSAPVEMVAIRQSRRILGKNQRPWDMGDATVVYTMVSAGTIRYRQKAGESLRAAAVRATSDMYARCRAAQEQVDPTVSSAAPSGGPADVRFLREVAAVVPVFDPEPALPGLCRGLLERFGLVVVVDDGSARSREAFDMLPPEVVVLRHDSNRGKGAAIKTALTWLDGRVGGAVFVDGDGQHDPRDALAVAAKMVESGETVLGVRDLGGDGVPARSRIGNAWMRFYLRLFCGARVSDTQTGLRAIPSRLFRRLASVRGDRFEYEMRMLAMLHRAGERIGEVSIRTIYVQGNRTSHHRPFRDSVRIWFGLAGECMSPRLRADPGASNSERELLSQGKKGASPRNLDFGEGI